MIRRADCSFSQLDAICRQTEEKIANFLANVKNADRLRCDLLELLTLLGCVPLGTYEHQLIVARINNAQRYLESSEHGAARYEICQLVSVLRARLPGAGNSKAIDESIGKNREDSDDSTPSSIPANG